jgi:hypothetical protein
VALEAAAAPGGAVGTGADALTGGASIIFSMFLPEGGHPSQPSLSFDPRSGVVDIDDLEASTGNKDKEGNHQGENKSDDDLVDNSIEPEEPDGNAPNPSKNLDDHEKSEQTKSDFEATTAQNTAQATGTPTTTANPTFNPNQEVVEGTDNKSKGGNGVEMIETTASPTTAHETMQITEAPKQTAALKPISSDHKSLDGQSKRPTISDSEDDHDSPGNGDKSSYLRPANRVSKTTSYSTSVDDIPQAEGSQTHASTTDTSRDNNDDPSLQSGNRVSKTSAAPTSTATSMTTSTQVSTIGNLESDYLVPHTVAIPTTVHKSTQAMETHQRASAIYPYPDNYRYDPDHDNYNPPTTEKETHNDKIPTIQKSPITSIKIPTTLMTTTRSHTTTTSTGSAAITTITGCRTVVDCPRCSPHEACHIGKIFPFCVGNPVRLRDESPQMWQGCREQLKYGNITREERKAVSKTMDKRSNRNI